MQPFSLLLTDFLCRKNSDTAKGRIGISVAVENGAKRAPFSGKPDLSYDLTAASSAELLGHDDLLFDL